ncbi:MAG: ABC transporter ATP-binding protein [Candidatus Omnitrophica bacterium]|nr:ABC transporter ATP-binding protein [Candidatus Omnitrophota bacterium]
MTPIIQAHNVSKRYKDVEAVTGVSLSVDRGEIFGLIGPDGAGKSTLIHILTGVLRTKEGQVTVLGKDVLKDPESVKTSIGLLPQGLGLALAAELSIEENVNFFAEINHVDPRRREERKALLLEKTQLAPFRGRQAKNLSGGMKQKLALCCTLIHEPELLFLDEPTTGVDPISRRELWTLINGMVREKGLTVFLTTSYMDEAARCHRVALLHQGKIIEEGKPDALPFKLEGKLAEIEAEDQHAALTILKKMPGVKIVYPMGERLSALHQIEDLNEIKGYAERSGIRIKQIEARAPSIEDVFLSKVAGQSEEVKEEVFEEFFQGKGISTEKRSEIMIETESLEKKFGDFTAVDKVSFQVKRGEIFGFLGPNGAGKTTTIKMLCGLFPPTAGRGTIAGLDLFKHSFEIKKSIGYMSQKFSLYRDLTVAENIQLYGGIYGVPPQELKRRLELILKIADLEGKGGFITGDLPMGIKQRLALGCAIIHKPECIFLDEPTSGVDPVARRKFWDIIFLLSRKMGVTVLVTTHYMDEAEQCDRLLLIHRGSVVALGRSEELKNQVNEEIGTLLELGTSDPFLAVEILKKHFPHCLIYGINVHLYTASPDEAIPSIRKTLEQNQIALKDVRKRTMPFEDVFVYFCEKTQQDKK